MSSKAYVMRYLIMLLGVSCMALAGYAQDEPSNVESLFKVDYDTPLTIDLEEEEEKKEEEKKAPKKKKKKRNFYFGRKTKKHFVRHGFGNETVYELFNYLKDYVGPPEYARDFYWYDYKKKKIVNSLKANPKRSAVLHGPYKKTTRDGQVLEKGYFYKGLKHKRWVRFNSHDILQDKKYYWKGWPQDALMSYYDFEREELKEVIPVHHGEKEGEYWAFHQDGSVAVRGRYKFDYKVGMWREYYPNRRVKREVKYPEDPFDFENKGVIIREWDRNGQLLYDREEYMEEMSGG